MKDEQSDPKRRETGQYWVKKHAQGWRMCNYYAHSDTFYNLDGPLAFCCFTLGPHDKIDERRIVRPEGLE